jgi:hypothetical protein
MFKVITPTGDRPECFELCKKYINYQTVRPDLWIIVDDGVREADLSGIEVPYMYIRRDPTLKDRVHTLKENMLLALEHVNDQDMVYIFEDDDYYSPYYIDTMLCYFNHDLIGLACPLVYHIGINKYYASLAESTTSFARTAFKGKIKDRLIAICNSKDYIIDSELWRPDSDKSLIVLREILHVSIKGMPGRLGITAEHNPEYKNYTEDGNYVLKIIGEHYADFIK